MKVRFVLAIFALAILAGAQVSTDNRDPDPDVDNSQVTQRVVGHGLVKISSKPPNAKIIMNGRTSIHRTNKNIWYRKGKKLLRITLSGYEDYTKEFNLSENEIKVVSVTLKTIDN